MGSTTHFLPGWTILSSNPLSSRDSLSPRSPNKDSHCHGGTSVAITTRIAPQVDNLPILPDDSRSLSRGRDARKAHQKTVGSIGGELFGREPPSPSPNKRREFQDVLRKGFLGFINLSSP